MKSDANDSPAYVVDKDGQHEMTTEPQSATEPLITMSIDDLLTLHPLPWSRHLLLIKDANGNQVIHVGGLYSERGRLYEGKYLSGLNALFVELVNSRVSARTVAPEVDDDDDDTPRTVSERLARHEHIAVVEGVLGGMNPLVSKTRISVRHILTYLYNGNSIEYIAENYNLSSEAIKDAIAFAQDVYDDAIDSALRHPATPRSEAGSRHPQYTHQDDQRIQDLFDSLPECPTEEQAEAVLQASGTSGKQVVNEFIEQLLRENLELREQLTTVAPVEQKPQTCASCGHSDELDPRGRCISIYYDAGGSLVYCNCKCVFAAPAPLAETEDETR